MKLRNGDIGYSIPDPATKSVWGSMPVAKCALAFALGLMAAIPVVLSVINDLGVGRWSEFTKWGAMLSSVPGAVITSLVSQRDRQAHLAAAFVSLGTLAPLLWWRRAPFVLLVFAGSNIFFGQITASLIQRFKDLYRMFVVDGGPPCSSLNCVKCGYWLPGLSQRRCPECGEVFGRQGM